MRAGETGEFIHQTSDTITTTTITGENLWRGREEYFDEFDQRFIQIGDRKTVDAPPDPDAPRIGVDGDPRRLVAAGKATGGALFFASVIPFIFTFLREGVAGAGHLPGGLAQAARDLGLWETFTVLFIAGFPPLALCWIAYRWRAFFPSYGQAEALVITSLAATYSLAFGWFFSPWNDESTVSGAIWSVFWALFWPFLNVVLVGVSWFWFQIMEEASTMPP